jgi:glycosyltransferase involved in cell wall biosynthesis
LIIHPEFRSVVRAKIPQIILFHDFIFYDPQLSGVNNKWSLYLYHNYKYKVATRVRHLITNSEFTRKKALKLFPGLDPGAIKPLHLGFRKLSDEQKPIQIGDIKEIHFLYVGSLMDPRKNIFNMIDNLEKIVPEHKPSTIHLVGNVFAKDKKTIEKYISGSKLKKNIILHGKVSDDQLKRMFHKAHFFLFPSLMEGFGLPIIEAMSFGIVVCAFNNSTIYEVGNSAIIIKEDNDFLGWGMEIEKLLQDTSLYTALSRKALQRSRCFTEQMMFKRYDEYFTNTIKKLSETTKTM